MKMELIKSNHSVGESNFHIQLTPAFRRDIFVDEQTAELTLVYLAEKLIELRVVLVGYGFGPNHLHFVCCKCSICQRGRACKTNQRIQLKNDEKEFQEFV